MTTLYTLCLVAVGLINFVPVLGVISAARMEQAYEVQLPSRDLQILMRHRALLFGALGGFVLYSVFFPVYQTVALVLAGISMIGFVIVAALVGEYNQRIYKVIMVDLVGIAALLVAVVIGQIEGAVAAGCEEDTCPIRRKPWSEVEMRILR